MRVPRGNSQAFWRFPDRALALPVALLLVASIHSAGAAEPFIPWTTSRVIGSPEPPPPYRTELAFPRLRFKNPVLISSAPGTSQMFVAEQAGAIYSFDNVPAAVDPQVFFDSAQIRTIEAGSQGTKIEAVYGLAFHPEFERNRYCYICYVLGGETAGLAIPDGTRVSRFTVTDDDPPRCDLESEQIVITWLAGGHNGGCLAFGPEGYLYISTGDAASPNPPDVLDVGQDVSNLLSAILRIDVDRVDPGLAYRIPPDNPFVVLEGARGEIWSYGFRNPWRMSFDRATGDLWVGDVGWELWEMIYKIERGGNYGWSVMEGSQQVRPEAKRGPTPILPPTIELPHSQAASITGGYVYRGERLPDLQGAYIFGDWETHRMWAARHDGERVASLVEIVEPTLRIVSFGEDNAGELYIVDYDEGTIHRLEKNDSVASQAEFPRKLSVTGLFDDTPSQRPAQGVYPYSIRAAAWADGATADRWIGLPEPAVVNPRNIPVPGTIMQERIKFAPGTVLVKTISIELSPGRADTTRRLETQLLHYNGRVWNGYTYAWNEDQTDAELVVADGGQVKLSIADPDSPGDRRTQTWSFPARVECVRCHNPWAQHTLAFNLQQLAAAPVGAATDELTRFHSLGAVVAAPGEQPSGTGTGWPFGDAVEPLCDPGDPAVGLDRRARAYLHVNCSHCHQLGAGGTADLEFRHDVPLDETKTVGVRPVQGTFEIHDAAIVAPGDPFRSVLFYRLAKLGRGRMPHIGSERLDEEGLRLIRDWISGLPGAGEEPATSVPPEELADTAAIDRQLDSTLDALRLACAMRDGGIPAAVRAEAIARGMARSEPQIRDLFEPFVPEEERTQRLGNAIRPEQILALVGDAERGKGLFFNVATVQCKTCHRIGDSGSTLGPELTEIGKKHDKPRLLETILEPSKLIDPKYVTWLAETSGGQVHTGLLAERSEQEIVLKDARDQLIRIPAADVEQLVPQTQSLMPELLLRDMTAEQVADLLAYLSSLQ